VAETVPGKILVSVEGTESMLRWFQSKEFEVQLIILAVIFDPLGFASGYLIAPSFDISPLYGGIAGLIAGSFVLSFHVLYTTVTR
jgi:hypothetical protein